MVRHVFTLQNAEKEDIWAFFTVFGGQIIFVKKEDRRTYGKPSLYRMRCDFSLVK